MRDGQLSRNRAIVLEPYMQLAEPQRADDAASLARMRAWQFAALVDTAVAAYAPNRRTWGPLAIPDSALLVLGDNRDNAYDSRYWGFVPADHVYGRIGTIYFSYDPASSRSLPFLTAIRWDRIGSTPQ
jgi:signal peptidase I